MEKNHGPAGDGLLQVKKKKSRKKSVPEKWQRSLTKAMSYRALIMVLDFIVILLFTRRADLAVWFVIISNLYTTVAYFLHERIWNKIQWGIRA